MGSFQFYFEWRSSPFSSTLSFEYMECCVFLKSKFWNKTTNLELWIFLKIYLFHFKILYSNLDIVDRKINEISIRKFLWVLNLDFWNDIPAFNSVLVHMMLCLLSSFRPNDVIISGNFMAEKLERCLFSFSCSFERRGNWGKCNEVTCSGSHLRAQCHIWPQEDGLPVSKPSTVCSVMQSRRRQQILFLRIIFQISCTPKSMFHVKNLLSIEVHIAWFLIPSPFQSSFQKYVAQKKSSTE